MPLLSPDSGCEFQTPGPGLLSLGPFLCQLAVWSQRWGRVTPLPGSYSPADAGNKGLEAERLLGPSATPTWSSIRLSMLTGEVIPDLGDSPSGDTKGSGEGHLGGIFPGCLCPKGVGGWRQGGGADSWGWTQELRVPSGQGLLPGHGAGFPCPASVYLSDSLAPCVLLSSPSRPYTIFRFRCSLCRKRQAQVPPAAAEQQPPGPAP